MIKSDKCMKTLGVQDIISCPHKNSKLQLFKKSKKFDIFIYMISFLSLFVAIVILLVECTENILMQEQVRCFMLTVFALMVNMINFYILLISNLLLAINKIIKKIM